MTAPQDHAADLVVAELGRRDVPVVRMDAADFPVRMRMATTLDGTGWSGTLSDAHRTLDLDRVRAVYNRRPGLHVLPSGMSPPVAEYAMAQARDGFGGVLMALDGWVNHPARNADASVKPWALAIAAECGFATPATLVTNDPAAVRAFADQHGPVVCKPLRRPAIVEGGVVKAVYTRLLTVEDLADLTGIETTAHLVQAYVPKSFELRVTVVDDQVFTARVDAGSDAARIDWRADYDALTWRPCDLPGELTAPVHAYMKATGLVYGAFDFAVDQAGTPWYLECNPNGQFGWLIEAAGLPIHHALADVLQAGTAR
ncbi:ATP-grasp ribosomal peptide maturase [Actinomadura meridiana]|uniref:ATP-grasp ribosomal peptide maturase n=1 Tax=Actinomadura meridiana TaxID=559626 RepID=UPI0031E7B42A